MDKMFQYKLNYFLKISLSYFVCIIVFTSCEKLPSKEESVETKFKNYEHIDSLNLKCKKTGKLLDFELISSYSVDQLKAILGPTFETLINYNVELYKRTTTPAGTVQWIMQCNDDGVQYKVSSRVYLDFLEFKQNKQYNEK